MVLNDGTNNYPISKPYHVPTVWYKVMLDNPEQITLPLSGTVTVESNDGFILAEINTADYARQYIEGKWLVFSNLPEPEPDTDPEPEDEPDADDVLNALLGVDE